MTASAKRAAGLAPAATRGTALDTRKDTCGTLNTQSAPMWQARRTDGRKGAATYLGDALRHCRRAAELNLRHGPAADTAASVRHARDALDGATWICDYAAAERDK